MVVGYSGRSRYQGSSTTQPSARPGNSCTGPHGGKSTQSKSGRSNAGSGAEHGVIIREDTVLQQTWVQEQCEHFQVIILVSGGKHFITYFRHTRLLSGPTERDGSLWLQELKVERPIVDLIR